MTRRPLVLLGLAATSAVAAFAVWFAAFALPGGGTLDGRALVAFTGVARAPLQPRIMGLANLADPWPFAIAAVALVVGACCAAGGSWPPWCPRSSCRRTS